MEYIAFPLVLATLVLCYLSYKCLKTKEKIDVLENESMRLLKSVAELQTQKEVLKNHTEETIQNYEEKRKLEVDLLIKDYIKEQEQFRDKRCADIEISYDNFVSEKQEQAKIIEDNIENLKAIELTHKEAVSAAIEAAKRAQEIKEQGEFYKIQLSEDDIEEIEAIKKALKDFRKQNFEAIQKIIWKVYYERPVNDLMHRIVKDNNKTGIYKITDLETEMCYIGQSKDIPTRLKTHIKAGLGINSSNNRLYSTMKQKNPENFSYEILEFCTADKLNEKERYWIDFYESNKYGLNTLKGVKS